MARRTKRPRVVWLPNTNANSIGAVPASTAQSFTVDVSGNSGDFSVGEIPIVIDSDQDPIGAADVSLADIFDSGYRLRRIVGKIFIGISNSGQVDAPPVVLVTAGLIVRRADNTGTSLALQVGNAANLAPSDIQNASDPWIWRRAWLLRNKGSSATSPVYKDDIPSSNIIYGRGVADGAHVDVKTARVIGPEERLFLDVSSLIVVAADAPGQQLITSAFITADLRVLASMKSSYGNRRNASR